MFPVTGMVRGSSLFAVASPGVSRNGHSSRLRRESEVLAIVPRQIVRRLRHAVPGEVGRRRASPRAGFLDELARLQAQGSRRAPVRIATSARSPTRSTMKSVSDRSSVTPGVARQEGRHQRDDAVRGERDVGVHP